MGAMQGLAVAAIVMVIGSALWALKAVTGVASGVWAAVRRPRTWLIGVPAMGVVLLLGVPAIYVKATETTPPPPMSLADLVPDAGVTTTTTSASTSVTSAPAAGTDTTLTTLAAAATATTVAGPAGAPATGAPTTVASPVAGPWAVGTGSEARYNVNDNILGQSTKVVGRTTKVTGSMQIVGQTVTAVQVVVDMQSVMCGCVHDSEYSKLLETSRYPTSTFTLTTPIALASIPAEGAIVQVPVVGRFTIHGVTRTVRFTLSALRRAGLIAVNGTIPVAMADYGINPPNAGSFGSVSDASIELLIAFRPAH